MEKYKSKFSEEFKTINEHLEQWGYGTKVRIKSTGDYNIEATGILQSPKEELHIKGSGFELRFKLNQINYIYKSDKEFEFNSDVMSDNKDYFFVSKII